MASKAKAAKFKIVEPKAAAATVLAAATEPEAQVSSEVKKYAFPTKVRCPVKMGGCNTLATRRRGESRDGSQQFRVCMKPSCRLKFRIDGWLA